jgi:subtilisin family serine protease
MSNLLPLLVVLISVILATGSLDVLLKDAFQAHGVPPKQVGLLRQQDAVTVSDRRLQFVCGPLDEFHGTRQILEVESGEPASTAWVSKKNGGKGCLLTQLSAQQVVSMRLGAGWTIESIPDALKIHPTVLTYLQQSPQQQQLQRRKHGTYDEKTASEAEEEKEDKSAGVDTSKIDDQKILEHELLVEFGSRVVVGEAEGLWSGIVTSLVTAKLPTTASGALAGKPWNKLVEKYLLHSPSSFASVSVECSQALKRASVELRSHSLIFSSVEHHSTTCLVALVRVASQHPSVLRVSMQPKAQLVNYEARGIVQTGGQDDEPYREAGLEGQGQICGVADSGLNDLSCFFVDDSSAYPTQTTNRSGIVEPMRRKVIQYVAHADAVDEEGGHGTHVCGTVAGSSTQEFGKMSGMAPKAKIAFFDIGVTNRDFLKLPAVVDIFGEAYAAGARVHTNSWGNLGGIYGQMSYDVDEYAYSHPDFLIVFAAGNSGDLGGKSVISPGNSKNTLSVGAAQVRTVLSDEPRTYAAGNTALAYFSSIGPTCDGRCVFSPLPSPSNWGLSFATPHLSLFHLLSSHKITG